MFGDAIKRLEYVGQQVQDQAGYRNFLTTVGILLYATGHDARANALLQEAQARGQAGMDLDEIIGYARPIGDTPFDKFVPWVYREFSRLAFETPDDYIAAANALASVAPHLATWQRKTKIDLNRLRMAAVIAAIEAWLAENRRDPALPGRVVYRFADGWAVHQLTTEAQIVSEGVAMLHCMRDPAKDYTARATCAPGTFTGAVNIYSLRDPDGVSFATLMQQRPGGRFVEVRSVGNKAVPPQLQPYVDEFVAAAPELKTPPSTDMLGAMRTTGLTIFIDEHPNPTLGYVISSLRYAHIDDDAPIGSGPSAEADTLAQAQQIAHRIATAARKRGVADVEILVEGDASGLGSAARGYGVTYAIDDAHGNQITTGLPAHTARRTAQRMADERGGVVLLYLANSGEADDGEIIRPRRGGGLGAARAGSRPLNVPEQIRHGSFGPIVWQRGGTTRMATQRDMDRLPVGPDLTRAEESAIAADDGEIIRPRRGGGLGAAHSPSRGRRRVFDMDTGNKLPGHPSVELVRASLAATPEGAVGAYRDEHDVWQYVAHQDTEHFLKNLRLDVRVVYVA